MSMKLAVSRRCIVFGFIMSVFMACLRCLAADEMKDHTENLEGGYCILVPNGAKVNHVSPVEDFIVYTVKDANNRVILQIYIGNHPQSSTGNPSIETTGVIGGFSATSRKWIDDKSLFFGEVRISLLSGNGWPMFAHMSYGGLSRKDFDSAEKIIQSFKKGKI